MSAAKIKPMTDLRFPHRWKAEILPSRPIILPRRHFVYPRAAEEVERGALEVMIDPRRSSDDRPGYGPCDGSDDGLGFVSRASGAEPFLATCALGFRDHAVPTGLWSTPDPEQICAVAGGYAYLIDTTAPERFTMIPYRPVMELRSAVEEGLLLFVGQRSIAAWGRTGQAWESEKLSDEGVKIAGIENGMLCGIGWEMKTDKESAFALDLTTGSRLPLE